MRLPAISASQAKRLRPPAPRRQRKLWVRAQGIVQSANERAAKDGSAYGQIWLEVEHGDLSCWMWPHQYAALGHPQPDEGQRVELVGYLVQGDDDLMTDLIVHQYRELPTWPHRRQTAVQ